MNSKLKAIFFEISHNSNNCDNANSNRINLLIEDYISSEQNSLSNNKIIDDTFIKHLINLIENLKSEIILDYLYSLFCCIIDKSSIKENHHAMILFNFGKTYSNLDISSKCSRVVLNYFLLNQSFSKKSYPERYKDYKNLISSKFDLCNELNILIESINQRIKLKSFYQYQFNLIIILLQSILPLHNYAFQIIKSIFKNSSNLSQIHFDNIFKLLYRINENIVNEINFTVKDKGNNVGITLFFI